MQQQENLKTYIYQQLQSGLHPQEIAQQLRDAGWDEASISNAFTGVQAAITHSLQARAPQPAQNAQPQDVQQQAATTGQPVSQSQTAPNSATPFGPTGKKRGRIKTAWLLMKQSFKVLRGNTQLLRYPFIAGLIALVLAAIFLTIIFTNSELFLYETVDSFGDKEFYLTGPGMVVAFVYYTLSSFAVFFYSAALAAHVLEIFRGQSRSYRDYMQVARSKIGTIFFYSLITATVGVILRAIEQRSRLLGLLVARLVGALWALANLFTIPIIVETDGSAPRAIKQSAQLFISRWGENVAARIGFGGIMFLLYLIVFVPLILLTVFLVAGFEAVGLAFGLFILIASIIVFVTLEIAASNVLNTALYYYARYEKIPAAFDPELLNAVFIPKEEKKRGLFKGKQA